MDSECAEPAKLRVGVLGKVLMWSGILLIVAYIAVRWTVLAYGGGYDLYGIHLFQPDKIGMVISMAVLAIFFGLLLQIISRQFKQLYEIGKELEDYIQPISEEK